MDDDLQQQLQQSKVKTLLPSNSNCFNVTKTKKHLKKKAATINKNVAIVIHNMKTIITKLKIKKDNLEIIILMTTHVLREKGTLGG